jgi:hypothetical protein
VEEGDQKIVATAPNSHIGEHSLIMSENTVIDVMIVLVVYPISKSLSNCPGRPLVILIIEVVGEMRLGHPRVVLEHVGGVLRNAERSHSVKGKHPHLSVHALEIDLLDAQGLLGGEVHHWVLGALEKLVDYEVEDVIVVVLLIQDLCGQNLHYQGYTHFPFSLTTKNT